MSTLRCIGCGDPVNPNKLGVYRQVQGWEKVRAGGGANQIVMRKETGALMCSPCGERAKLHDRHGIVEGQGSLL